MHGQLILEKFHYRVFRAWPKIVKYIMRITAQPRNRVNDLRYVR